MKKILKLWLLAIIASGIAQAFEGGTMKSSSGTRATQYASPYATPSIYAPVEIERDGTPTTAEDINSQVGDLRAPPRSSVRSMGYGPGPGQDYVGPRVPSYQFSH